MSDQDDFRKAMRNYIYSVSILSNKNIDGELNAITVSSVTSISMEPPSLLVCINKSSRIHDTLIKNSDFCINLLNKNQQEISNICSTDSLYDQRFDHDKWNTQTIPFLEEAQANIFCSIEDLVPYHTHTIVIGRVLNAISNDKINTLSYVNGKYV
ncbi:MAG: oxidoreductase [Gammaproteobacteria bacterium]|nr:oxidoreductase [Gammaproteobacteria bacterium]